MPAVSLKTKVVAAITGLVAAIVATLSALYISEVVHQRIQEAYSSSLLICDQVFAVARDALAVDLTNAKIDMHDPVQVTAAMEELLHTHSELNPPLASPLGNSPPIYDPTDTEAAEMPARRSDEYGAVSTKIERLGRQMRDVKEVFSALKENLDQMMANLQDGVMLFTSDFRAVLVSASAERFIGKPRSAMLGCHPSEIFSADSPLGRAILEAIQTRRPVGQEEIEADHGRHVQISLDFIAA